MLASTGNADTFTKLDQDGHPLSHDATSWTCVADQATGLMIEVKNPARALHNPADWFVYWQPGQAPGLGGRRANSDSDGAEFFNESCFGYTADTPSSYCNSADFINRVNQSDYCGYSDWRLPNIAESTTLNIAGSAYFPHQGRDTVPHWTSSTDGMGNALSATLNGHVLRDISRDSRLRIRLVRSKQ